MKRILLLAMVTLFVLLFLIPLAMGQEGQNATFTVRSTEVVTGVVIISGQMTTTAGKRSSLDLQCNKGFSMCSVPQPGTYVMVRLPKNRGSYDCANVDLYREGADPASSEAIGEYCLIQK
jgi:hypothetical protein